MVVDLGGQIAAVYPVVGSAVARAHRVQEQTLPRKSRHHM